MSLALRQKLKGPVRGNVLIVAALCLAALVLAVVFSPWMGAGAHPFILRAELEPGARLEAVLADGWSAPLVLTEDGFYATELPPRREYSLCLRSDGGVAKVSGAWIMKLPYNPYQALHTFKPSTPLELTPGNPVEIAQAVPVTQGGFWRMFAAFFVCGFLFVWGLFALTKPDADTPPATVARGGFRLWQWAIVAALAGIQVWLVATSTPVFWPADSIGYASKALALYERGEFYTNGIFFEITRAPGAPLVEALAFKLFGVSVGAVALLQSLLYCAAAAFALDAVARVGSRWAALVAAPFVLLDPAAVAFCRTFASEAPFAVFALIVSGCLLHSLAAKGAREWFWTVLAVCASVYLVMVRPNGVILLAFPLFMIGRLLVRSLRERALPEVRRATLPLVMVLATLGALLAWCWRNERVQGYFAPTDIVGLSAAESCFKSGIFDIRASADDVAFYEEIVMARRASNYTFEAWSLADCYRKRVEAEGPVDKSAAKRVDLMEKAFAARSNAASPVSSRVARFARLFEWGIFLESDPNYQPYGLPNHRFIAYTREEWKRANDINVGWMGERFSVGQRPLGWAQRAFNSVFGAYKWGLMLVVSLALAAYALACGRLWLAGLVFFLPYFGNILLNAWLGVVVSRYVCVLEPFLVLGIAACAASWLAVRRR